MTSSEQVSRTAEFTVENIGGIDSTQVSIPPGVTVLTGKNATNRTSFLQSIMAAMGSNQATLKGDAEKGRVQMDLHGETYERTLTRAGDSVAFDGDGYLNDPDVADLFAFLLETNEARQSVTRGDDLREIIMRPVDIDDIKNRMRELEEQKTKSITNYPLLEMEKRIYPNLNNGRSRYRNRYRTKRTNSRTKKKK